MNVESSKESKESFGVSRSEVARLLLPNAVLVLYTSEAMMAALGKYDPEINAPAVAPVLAQKKGAPGEASTAEELAKAGWKRWDVQSDVRGLGGGQKPQVPVKKQSVISPSEHPQADAIDKYAKAMSLIPPSARPLADMIEKRMETISRRHWGSGTGERDLNIAAVAAVIGYASLPSATKIVADSSLPTASSLLSYYDLAMLAWGMHHREEPCANVNLKIRFYLEAYNVSGEPHARRVRMLLPDGKRRFLGPIFIGRFAEISESAVLRCGSAFAALCDSLVNGEVNVAGEASRGKVEGVKSGVARADGEASREKSKVSEKAAHEMKSEPSAPATAAEGRSKNYSPRPATEREVLQELARYSAEKGLEAPRLVLAPKHVGGGEVWQFHFRTLDNVRQRNVGPRFEVRDGPAVAKARHGLKLRMHGWWVKYRDGVRQRVEGWQV